MSSAPAVASTISNAITEVTSGEKTVADGSTFDLNFKWAVPDYSKEGDTFALALPNELVNPDGIPIKLRETDGTETVANGTWLGNTATFTMTNYVNKKPLNVHGDGFFSVRLNVAKPVNERTNLTTIVSGRILTLDVTPATGSSHQERGAVPLTRPAIKWGYWANPKDQGTSNSKSAIVWNLALPVTETAQNGPITVADVLPEGSGMAFDCNGITWPYYQTRLSDTQQTTMPEGTMKVESCEANRVVFTLPGGIKPYESVTASISTNLTETPARASYTNTFTFSNPRTDQTDVVQSRALRQTAGGTGSGLVAPSKPVLPVVPQTSKTPVPSVPPSAPPAVQQSKPTTPTPPNILAQTGAEVVGVIAIAGLVSVLGFILVAVARRRRRV